MKYLKTYESHITKRQSAVGIICNQDGKFLLLKRKPVDRTLANVWCLPGGKVDNNESPEEALKREFMEETSLEISDLKFIQTKENERFVIHFYYINDIADENSVHINHDEHDEFNFFGINDLNTIEVAPITLSILNSLK